MKIRVSINDMLLSERRRRSRGSGLPLPAGPATVTPISRRQARFSAGISLLALALSLGAMRAQTPPPSPGMAPPPGGLPSMPPQPPSKFKDFNEVTKGTTKYDGLFTLYRTNDLLYAEIKDPRVIYNLISRRDAQNPLHLHQPEHFPPHSVYWPAPGWFLLAAQPPCKIISHQYTTAPLLSVLVASFT